MSGWSLVYDGYDPEQEGLREALCALGNGYFVTRAAGAEAGADEVHYPGTYLVGGYDRRRSDVAGRVVENEDLVNLPNWLPLGFRIEDGPWFSLDAVEVLDYRQQLDLKRGVLHRTLRFRDPAGRTTRLASRRFVHMGAAHLCGHELVIAAEDWEGLVEVRAALDGTVRNEGVPRYRALEGQHLVPGITRDLGDGLVLLRVRTVQSRLEVAQAARLRLLRGAAALPVAWRVREEPGYIEQRVALEVRPGEALTVEKVVALHSSRDRAASESAQAAERTIRRAGRFDDLLRDHTLAWERLWRRFDLALDVRRAGLEDGHVERTLRLHIFHLLQTVSPHSVERDAAAPARGLHGEAYRGHIFWDELFVFPILNLRVPELARELLLYRHRRLDAAREAAAAAGLRGAMFPWQSGSDGREESQVVHLNPRSGRWVPDHTHLQRHVGAAVAWNVWSYYEATGDTDFLAFHGAEMLLEIARFWASLARFDPGEERWVIHGVVGPDEYHTAYPGAREPGLRDNAYTNVMAVWCLCRALDALELLAGHRRDELCGALGLGDDELARWEDVSRRMRVPFHGDGIPSQFDGYERLEELDWEAYRARYGDIHRLDRILEAEDDDVNRYQVSKQADLLMLFYLFSAEEVGALFRRLGYDFDPERIPAVVDYYLRRSSHGSTLSNVVHSWVLARSDRARSWELFRRALDSDVGDVQGGTTREGIHLGAMAGTVDLVQRCYTGLEVRDGVLRLNPCLPEALRSLRLRVHYRKRPLQLDVAEGVLTVSALPSRDEPIRIGFAGEVHALEPGQTLRFKLVARGACPPGAAGAPD